MSKSNSKTKNKNNKNNKNDTNIKIPKIKISNFEDVEEYLYDEYLEYFYNVEHNFFKYNQYDIFEKIINEEQIKFLEYMLSRYALRTGEILDIIIEYKGKERPKEILNILFKKYPSLKNDLMKDDNFKRIIDYSSLKFIKEINKLREENNYKQIEIKLEDCYISELSSPDVFNWFIDKQIIKLDNQNEIYEFICSELANDYFDTVNKFETLLNKLNLNKKNLNEIFKSNVDIKRYNLNIISNLIEYELFDIIYYLFDNVDHKYLIPDASYAFNIFLEAISNCDYKLFSLICKCIREQGFDNVFTNYDEYYCELDDYLVNNHKVKDERILFELLKLKIQPSIKSKFYQIYNNLVIAK